MPMSEYMRMLRQKVGTTVIGIPSVSIILPDSQGRILLLRDAGSGDWTTPGGMVEPYETPADAAVREMWEETGLYVAIKGLLGVFGGTRCSTTYPNGDRTAWVMTVFEARTLGGTMRADGEEVLEARYFGAGEVGSIRCRPHLSLIFTTVWSRKPGPVFQRPGWEPPPGWSTPGG